MENITNFYETAPLMLAIYWTIAGVSSVLIIIQAILLLIGFDSDSDFSGGDTAFDADGMNLISVKTILCFLLGFGWTGAVFYPIFENKVTVALIALAVGVAFMFLIAFLLRQVLRLSADGTFTTAKVVGSVGSVYLRIPGPDEPGKVNVTYRGSMHELLAYSDTPIETGASVRVVRTVDASAVYVERC